MPTQPAYTYVIKNIVKFVDGDTIDAVLDLGFHVTIKKRVRLHGINTPEIRTRDKHEKEKGMQAKQRLIQLCENNTSSLILKCHGLGKYGRVLGEIYNPDLSCHGFDTNNVNSILLQEGHAEVYE